MLSNRAAHEAVEGNDGRSEAANATTLGASETATSSNSGPSKPVLFDMYVQEVPYLDPLYPEFMHKVHDRLVYAMVYGRLRQGEAYIGDTFLGATLIDKTVRH